MNEKSSFETGQIYTMYVEFRDNKGNYLEPRKGKFRPVVIYKDPGDNTLFACQMTSKINKPLYKKNGVLIQDIQAAGISKQSIIRLEYHSRYKIENPKLLKGPHGKLSERDIDNFLEKIIEVIHSEKQKQMDEKNLFSLESLKEINSKLKKNNKEEIIRDER